MCQASCAHSPRTIVKFTQPWGFPPRHLSRAGSTLETGYWAAPRLPPMLRLHVAPPGQPTGLVGRVKGVVGAFPALAASSGLRCLGRLRGLREPRNRLTGA